MGKDIRSSTSPIALGAPFPLPSLGDAMEEVSLSVDRFCLLAGVEALAEMMEEDATTVCGCPASPPWGAAGLSLGYLRERDRLPRRQSESDPATGS